MGERGTMRFWLSHYRRERLTAYEPGFYDSRAWIIAGARYNIPAPSSDSRKGT